MTNWPIQTQVKTHSGKLLIDRFEDGSLNIYGWSDSGKQVLDSAINQWEAQKIEDQFRDTAPKSFRATEERLTELILQGEL